MKRILIVDDHASIRELMRAVLEESGYSVSMASDGAEAVCRAREFSPDLIILDLEMPALNGFDAVRELRRDLRFATTPIVASSDSGMNARELALSAGFTSFMAKPFGMKTLRGELESLLGPRS